ncbi:histidine phosphatase family protein [Janthinobacterium fluminis]|uniref:Histidine phosphatase family protein n=1 Tax=Janthinobacterium fluminis TaxID=2987524 RepID=A0ABT5JY34_9BURK|nr:histidine phosphatase family protein [Janthinobacterium fluminis]MDC8757063.1 histidine phosphatase family protein [Janthinobacterium fluminis]
MGQIYLVRHGQASFGSADYDQLSVLGTEQARLLGQWFANSRQVFQRVVTGAMKRHRQTADACLAELPKALLADTDWQTDAGFNEFDHEQVLLRHRPDFADPAAFKPFMAKHAEAERAFRVIFDEAMARWMGGAHDADYTESWPAFRARCVGALERLAAAAAPAQTIVVFTSGGTIATLCHHLLGLPDEQLFDLTASLVNCSVTKLLYQPGKVGLSYLNNYAHLEWLGEADAVTYR